MNTVALIGRLVRDPERCTTDDGKLICKFSIAVRRGRDKTDFITCKGWDDVGRNIERYFHKGDYIGVIGNLRIEAYTTKHGDRASKATVYVEKFDFCSTAASENIPSGDPSEREEGMSMFDVQYDEEELPF